jgi:hypothetical protein
MDTIVEEKLVQTLSNVLLENDHDEIDGLDVDLITYVSGMLASKILEEDDEHDDTDEKQQLIIDEVLLPFLESVACPETLCKLANDAVLNVLKEIRQQSSGSGRGGGSSRVGGQYSQQQQSRKLQQGIVSMSSQNVSEQERESNAYLWGTEVDGTKKIKAMHNDLIDGHHDKTSAKDKRRARKVDAEKTRKLLSSAKDTDIDTGGAGLVKMNIRKLSSNNAAGADKRRDVNVRNVTVTLDNGTMLLESGELKFAYQRRYGLIGENGVGMYYYTWFLTFFVSTFEPAHYKFFS